MSVPPPPDALGRMSDYDRQAWDALGRVRGSGAPTSPIPRAVRERVVDVLRRVPGAGVLERAVGGGLDAVTDVATRGAATSVQQQRVIAAYRDAGHNVSSLADVRKLDLQEIDAVRPRLNVPYGAGAGGLSAGGALATGSRAALADAAIALGTGTRAIAHVAAYYGYDARRPEERPTPLARDAAGHGLDRVVVARVAARLAGTVLQRLTPRGRRKLRKAAEASGTRARLRLAAGAVGSGMAASRTVADADRLYRERFLREKYGLDEAMAAAAVAPVSTEPPMLVETVDEVAVSPPPPAAPARPVTPVPTKPIATPTPSPSPAPPPQSPPPPSVTAATPPAPSGTFALAFAPGEIAALAARYEGAADDAKPVAAGDAARTRGYYTAAAFRDVCAWKTPRSATKVGENSATEIRNATRKALATNDPAEQLRLLTALAGVGVPTASALLHFALPESVPTIDATAMQALGQTPSSSYGVSVWTAYVEAVRALAEQHNVSVRTLDHALHGYDAAAG